MLGNPYLMVALTGSIGSGKTAAANLFKALGVEIIDADVLAREVVAPGTPALDAIKGVFGPQIINSDGTLNRGALGHLVFSDGQARSKLEQIVHPRIRDLFITKKSLFEKRALKGAILMYVVPLLFESGNRYPEMQKVIVVSAPRETCLARIMQRDGCSLEQAQRKLDSQMPIEEKEKRADFVIKNDGSLDALEKSVKTVYEELKKLL